MDAHPATTGSPSRPYKIALTIAVVLFLLTLTIAVLIIIIANARETDREAEIEITLTAAFAQINRMQTAAAPLPTGAPPIVRGEYAFVAVDDTPIYSAGTHCDTHVLTGQIVDEAGAPLDGLTIWLWGDFVDPQHVITGEGAQQPAGSWLVALQGGLNRRVWLQVMAGERHVSPPVEIVFDADDCTRNRAMVALQQVAPLD